MKIVTDVEEFIRQQFKENSSHTLVFHNIHHTESVVEAVRFLSQKSNLPEDQKEMVEIAAWFHDLGYLRQYSDHEEASIEQLKQFFSKRKYDNNKLEKVIGCIQATKVPQQPSNELEKILCDADMYHLSLENLPEQTELLRQELKYQGESRNRRKHLRETLKYLSLPYHTRVAQHAWNEQKEHNKRVVEKLLLDLEAKKASAKAKKAERLLYPDIDKYTRGIEKEQIPIRGIESMFRLTARNQINLSSIADNKSNILITVNSLIISVVITLLARKYYELPHLIIPAAIFLLTCLTTMIFAILSTRPNISGGRFTKEDIMKKKANLLFFGNFYNMPLDEYDWGIRELMKDYDGLYGTMIKDQYFLGLVLAKKYKLLRTAYTIFMYGFIVTILAFTVAMIVYTG